MRSYRRRTAIFAGIFTLIQGGVWAFFAVWSVGIYSCTFDYPYFTKGKNTVGNLFYFSYEIGKCRSGEDAYSGPTGPTKPPPSWYPVPHRTYAIMLTYGLLSAIWIPSAILVLVSAVNQIHGKMGARCYYPWLVISAALIVLDIVASVIYGIDIAQTLTPQDYVGKFPYVGKMEMQGLEGLTVIPAVTMVVFFSRGIVIWLANLVLFGTGVYIAFALSKRTPTSEFVEREVRHSPRDNGNGQTVTSWVKLGRRSVGVPAVNELEMPAGGAGLGQRSGPLRWAPDLRRTDDTLIQSPTEEREKPAVPARPVLRPSSLSLPPPTVPPPPPPDTSPFFDVYGKPTTPDSPQPVFVRSNTAHQLSQMLEGGGVDKERPWSYVNPRSLPGPRGIPEPDYTLHKESGRRATVLGSLSTGPPSTPSEEGEAGRAGRRYENNPNVWKVM